MDDNDEEEQQLDKHLEKLIRGSARKIAPQLKRVNRAFETVAKAELRVYLRDNGITSDTLTDEEYDFIISMVEGSSTVDNLKRIKRFMKEYCFRQLRRVYTPRQTATYLRYSFKDTLIYFFFFTFYLSIVYAACHRLPWVVCVIVRIFMSLHLGYYNVVWMGRICRSLYCQAKELMSFMWQLMRFIPAIFFETTRVLFDVFVGWTLLGSIGGILFMIYIVPIAFPEMGLSCVFVELYIVYVGEPSSWIKVVTLFV